MVLPEVQTLIYRILKAIDAIPPDHIVSSRHIAALAITDEKDLKVMKQEVATVLRRIPCATPLSHIRHAIATEWRFVPPGKVCYRSCPYYKINRQQTPCPRREREGLPTRKYT